MTIRLNLVFLLAAALHGETPAVDEYQVKAAFLYNFAKFVEWPAGTFATSGQPIAICIAGQNPFGSTLEGMVRDKTVGDRTFVVRRLADPQSAGPCQILFIGGGERKRSRPWLEQTKNAAILSVGESDDFTASGGVVNFKLDGTRVRIQVCLEAADRAKLRISSKLLSLAEIIKN